MCTVNEIAMKTRFTIVRCQLSYITRLAIFLSLSTLSVATVCARAGDSTAARLSHQVTIPNTQLLKMKSSVVGQEYDLYVHLPRGYQDTTKTFCVLYLLDAQWDFPLVTAIFGQQYYDGFVPGLVIIGITWGGDRPNDDSLRTRDFTPTHMRERPQSGNAAAFLAFLKEELIPFVESKYRVTANGRTLMGSSLGGLFTLYAMFHEPGLFQRYVLTSPALSWDNEIIDADEKNYAAKNSHLRARLFMAVGEFEDVSGFQGFVDRLRTRKYEGLELQTSILDGMGHSGSKAEGFTRGLQAVFARPSLSVDPGVLEGYVGIYRGNSGVTVSVVRRADRLLASPPDNTPVLLHAETEDDFYVKGQYLFLHFARDTTNAVSGFLLERYEGEDFMAKIQ
jgi:predicted alpha/beta superfamily hydrolase